MPAKPFALHPKKKKKKKKRGRKICCRLADSAIL